MTDYPLATKLFHVMVITLIAIYVVFVKQPCSVVEQGRSAKLPLLREDQP